MQTESAPSRKPRLVRLTDGLAQASIISSLFTVLLLVVCANTATWFWLHPRAGVYPPQIRYFGLLHKEENGLRYLSSTREEVCHIAQAVKSGQEAPPIMLQACGTECERLLTPWQRPDPAILNETDAPGENTTTARGAVPDQTTNASAVNASGPGNKTANATVPNPAHGANQTDAGQVSEPDEAGAGSSEATGTSSPGTPDGASFVEEAGAAPRTAVVGVEGLTQAQAGEEDVSAVPVTVKAAPALLRTDGRKAFAEIDGGGAARVAGNSGDQDEAEVVAAKHRGRSGCHLGYGAKHRPAGALEADPCATSFLQGGSAAERFERRCTFYTKVENAGFITYVALMSCAGLLFLNACCVYRMSKRSLSVAMSVNVVVVLALAATFTWFVQHWDQALAASGDGAVMHKPGHAPKPLIGEEGWGAKQLLEVHAWSSVADGSDRAIAAQLALASIPMSFLSLWLTTLLCIRERTHSNTLVGGLGAIIRAPFTFLHWLITSLVGNAGQEGVEMRSFWDTYFKKLGVGVAATLLQLPLHFVRSLDVGGFLRDIASDQEKEKLGARGLSARPVCNLLAWRRSVCVCLLLIFVVEIPIGLQDIQKSVGNYARDRENMYWPDTLEDYKLDVDTSADFAEYSQKIAIRAAATVQHRAHHLMVWEKILSMGMNVVAALLALYALCSWSSFGLSRKFTTVGWLCLFGTPFLMSMVPVRKFLDYDSLDPLARTYATEVGKHFSFGYVFDMCEDVLTKGLPAVDQGQKYGMTACNALQKFPGKIYVPLIADYDLTAAHKACQTFKAYIADAKAEKALEELHSSCMDVVKAAKEHHDDDKTQAQISVATIWAESMVPKVKEGVQVVVGLMLALRNFAALLPAAMSLAPGLLRGATAVKILVPLSTVPGMFILILPWVYSPLLWCSYQVVFQLVGDWLLLIGLIVLAFAPLLYFALGVTMDITRPMQSTEIKRMVAIMSYYNMFMTLCGYGFIGGFVYKYYRPSEGLVNDETIGGVMETLADYQVVLVMVARLVFKYLYTLLAAVDWMTSEIARQRHHEQCLDALGQLTSESWSSAWPALQSWKEIHQLQHQVAEHRTTSLDSFVVANGDVGHRVPERTVGDILERVDGRVVAGANKQDPDIRALLRIPFREFEKAQSAAAASAIVEEQKTKPEPEVAAAAPTGEDEEEEDLDGWWQEAPIAGAYQASWQTDYYSGQQWSGR